MKYRVLVRFAYIGRLKIEKRILELGLVLAQIGPEHTMLIVV